MLLHQYGNGKKCKHKTDKKFMRKAVKPFCMYVILIHYRTYIKVKKKGNPYDIVYINSCSKGERYTLCYFTFFM